MKFIQILSVFLFLISCESKTQDIHKIEAISIVYTLPFLVNSDSINVSRDSGLIYTYKQFRLYKIPQQESNFMNNVLMSERIGYIYFGFDTTKGYGLLIDSTAQHQKKASVDSVLKDRPNGKWLAPLITQSKLIKDSVISSEVFMKIYKPDEPGLDWVHLYFSRSMRSFFSLSPSLDSLTNAKLCKAEVKIKDDTSANAAKFNKYRMIKLELGYTDITNSKNDILKIFELLKKGLR